jgi:CRP-like cAMP-binding protein
MSLSPYAKLLASIPMFSSVPPEDLEDLTAALTVRQVEKGGDVFRQGDKGSKLYVIEEGEVTISVGEGTRNVVLASLFKGQTFGEMSLLDGSPRSANATCPKATTLLELDRKHFVEFLKRRPLASIYIMAELGDRMRATNDLMARQIAKSGAADQEAARGGLGGIADALCRVLGAPSLAIGVTAALLALGGLAVALALTLISAEAGRPAPLVGALAACVAIATAAAAMVPLVLYHQNRQAERFKMLADNDFRVNLKNEVSIEAILRKQGEVLQRVALIERRVGLDFDPEKR